jgi:RHS repeat-associated protein
VPPISGAAVTFRYDPFGRRIQKSSSIETTNYLYDGLDSVAEINTSGALRATYTQEGHIDEPLAELRSQIAGYYDQDGLGSVTSLSNANGAVINSYFYNAFGISVMPTTSLDNALQYTGRDFDAETGLQYSRARYYDSTVGRFISEDPAQSGTNFYSYVRNNPITRTDPLGLWDTYTHHALFWNALRGCGVSKDDIWQMQQESDFIDLVAQLPGDAYMHSMRAPWQTPQSALQERDEWVQTKLNSAAQQYQQYGDTTNANNPTDTWTTPFADALHTITDSTSPAHMKNGVPIAWPVLPNALHHGDWPIGDTETWANMTPQLMQQNIDMIRKAFEQVTGHKCGCGQ